MKPISLSEHLLYSTIMMETLDGDRGTGFFFNFKFEETTVPIIITNKHVIKNDMNAIVTFALHLGDADGPSDENINVRYIGGWIPHSNHDLCFCFANPLFEQIKNKLNKDVFFIALEESLIFDSEALSKLSAVEDVLMIGYPIGLSDTKNNLPLFRKGITSSHPAISFNEQDIGAIDMACFPGSSGSPILILNEGSYYDKSGTVKIATRIVFLGVLFKGPIFNEEGKIVIKEIPTSQQVSIITPQMINLGYYIQAHQLLEFKHTIQEIIGI
jgi:hypothetical protein